MNTTDLREDIQAALAAIPSSDFLTETENLLAVLGYRSERDAGRADGGCGRLYRAVSRCERKY